MGRSIHCYLLLSSPFRNVQIVKKKKHKTFLEVYSDFFVTTRMLHGWLFCFEIGSYYVAKASLKTCNPPAIICK